MKFEEQHDIVYHSFCSAENCNENYIGESARRLDKRIKDHNGRDRNSHLFEHSVESRHDPVLENDFRIIEKGYRNNTSRRKIAEVLFIRKMKPSLNIQVNSFKLHPQILSTFRCKKIFFQILNRVDVVTSLLTHGNINFFR